MNLVCESNLLIRFCVIDSAFCLVSLDLDCFVVFAIAQTASQWRLYAQITRHCEGVSPKQSILATFESKANLGLWVNLNVNNLLIHFWDNDSAFWLDSLDLDCFVVFAIAQTASQWRLFAQIIRHCEGVSPKQSILTTFESKANFLFCVNLNAVIYWFDFGTLILFAF